jgi:hypothetical protein
MPVGLSYRKRATTEKRQVAVLGRECAPTQQIVTPVFTPVPTTAPAGHNISG